MVKVVSCFWNAENYIEKCINSVKNQLHKNFKMYLVDDVSTDKTVEQIKKLNHGFGGLVSYLGTSDAEEVSDMISEGHVFAKRVMKAMVYQIAKEIGSLYAVTRGNLDAIIITGGLAYNQDVLQPLLDYLDHLGEIIVYPGEDELEALAYNVYQLYNEKQELKEYE